MGWRVDRCSPMTISTAYRWVTTAVNAHYGRGWEHTQAKSFALFRVKIQPALVLRYNVVRNGPALPRESQEIMAPGDYGIYFLDGSVAEVNYKFTPIDSYSSFAMSINENVALTAKTSLTSNITREVLDRDGECVFSGVTSSQGSNALVVTWIFPPFLGYTLTRDPWVEHKYHADPDACDFSEFMVATNAISGQKHIIALFYENKLGIDIDDDYRIVCFDGLEYLEGGVPLKSHLTLLDGPNRPSDRFLRLHFERCLSVSVYGGDVFDDYARDEIENFIEDLGVYDNEIDTTDPRWLTPLGIEVYAYLIRDKMAERGIEEEEPVQLL